MPVEQAAGIMNKTLTTLSKEPLYGSILQSILRRRASEIDFINGYVDKLMDLSTNQDGEGIKRILQEILPEYKPQRSDRKEDSAEDIAQSAESKK